MCGCVQNGWGGGLRPDGAGPLQTVGRSLHFGLSVRKRHLFRVQSKGVTCLAWFLKSLLLTLVWELTVKGQEGGGGVRDSSSLSCWAETMDFLGGPGVGDEEKSPHGPQKWPHGPEVTGLGEGS